MTASDRELLAACDRLLAVEREISQMDISQRVWFMENPGHRDSFAVARALKAKLEGRDG